MNKLSTEDIVLLNCFNYLNIGKQENKNLGEVVNNILEQPIEFNRVTRNNPAAMPPENWKEVLEKIKDNEKLCSLTIQKQSQQMGYDPKGLNAVCFLDEQSKKATVVFRGTGSGEWIDNGLAFSEKNSPQELQAVEYFERAVNELKLPEKGYTIDVTGHSKGGNKAQFVTLNCDIVHQCYSFDGQGFSKEALEYYKDKIDKNSYKITSIAADNDYVHCLGNEIAGRKELFETKYRMKPNEFSDQIVKERNNPLKKGKIYSYNHCPDAILNKNGGLTPKVEKEPWFNVMINRYTRHLMELDKEMKKEIFTSGMGLAQIYLGKKPAIANRIPSIKNTIKAFSEASFEFINWFSKDRNRFTLGQKLGLASLGPLVIQFGLPAAYVFKYHDFKKLENQVFGKLRKDIDKEFGNTEDGKAINKVLDNTAKDAKELINSEIKNNIDINNMDKLKSELICNLKAKDELNYITRNTNDLRVNAFCKRAIREVEGNIGKLEGQIKLTGDVYKKEIDHKLKYINEKLSDPQRYTKENNLLNDVVKEKEINEVAKNALEEMKPEFLEKLKDINKIYESEKKLSELKKEGLQVNKINEELRKLQIEKNALNVAKESLETVDKYKPIVDTYNSKKLFKNSYGNKHASEIQEYNKAQKSLESIGVNNWSDYKAVKEMIDSKEKSLEGHEKISGADASIRRAEEIGKCKNKQNEIMKKHTPEPMKSKVKAIGRGMDR